MTRASTARNSVVLCPERVYFIGTVGLIQSPTDRSHLFLAF